MTAREIADDFALRGFEGAEEILIPDVMVGGTRVSPAFADQWTTFYDAQQEGEVVRFEIGDGITWNCPATQEVEVR